MVDRLEDFAFSSLSTILYCSYTVRVTAMMEDMADFFRQLNLKQHISTSHHLTISPPHHHSVLILSTGFCVATRHDCATTVAMTTAETPTKLSGKSHQWSGVCSAKLCSHCMLSQ